MITLHHLRVGRSVFTAWLLEELGLEYDLKIYNRNELRRAPPELKEIHPLGKSPVIEDDGMVIAESGVIATYLVERYAPESSLLPPANDLKARIEWTQWLHYSEASAFAPLLMKMLLAIEPEPKPPVTSAFAAGECSLQLGYIQDQLGDKPYLLGDELQLPDIGITFVLQMAQQLGELGAYPKLQEYVARTTARPAFQRALERTGG